ncbi:MAG: 3'-5' exonuclease [Verrucomicrobiales bacterium]|nr:3'-5' exonuclease [Verrucomicrobiota bacterium JB025]
MNFRIADTFTDSLTKLTSQDQKAAKTTVFDLQINPANPGLSFHRVDHAKDPHFWSVRANRDIRIIVHKTEADLLVCYVDHHDKAYKWAEKRKIQQHPKTGAIQLVEIRERVEEIPVFVQVEQEQTQPPQKLLFQDVRDETFLNFGVPEEWLPDARQATEDTLFDLTEHLPQEAAEALLELATGGTPEPVSKAPTDGYEHPDTQRRFRLVTGEDELSLALEYPWEKWTTFLHPSQKAIVERHFNGPARVSGSAGTGKTIVALHRAVHLARQNPGSRILLTTFSDALADLLRIKLDRLVGASSEIRNRITLKSLPSLAKEFAGDIQIAEPQEIASWIEEALEEVDGHQFSKRLVRGEWNHIFDAWQIMEWESYKSVPRPGMKTRLGANQREVMFRILSLVREKLTAGGKQTWPSVYQSLSTGREISFDHIIVDEAQDLGVSQLRFLARIASSQTNNLFLAGDIGQRIFQTPFSWKSLGIDIRGRSSTLRVNYRTSHQIRKQADKLLPDTLKDTDGNEESRKGTISLFNGPNPDIRIFENSDGEIEKVSEHLHTLLGQDFHPEEIGLFVRSAAQMPRARAVMKASGLQWNELEHTSSPSSGRISLSTMHLAKGLEFRAVIVMACDDEIIPLQERIESITDEADLEEVYTTERHLLYVACTRARDQLLITAVNPASEFLDDLG